MPGGRDGRRTATVSHHTWWCPPSLVPAAAGEALRVMLVEEAISRGGLRGVGAW